MRIGIIIKFHIGNFVMENIKATNKSNLKRNFQKFYVLVCLFAICFIISACDTLGSSLNQNSNSKVPENTLKNSDKKIAKNAQKFPSFMGDDDTAKPGAPTTRYIVQIQMAVVNVPLSVASEGEDLWSNLDEEPVSMQSTALGLNGIRVGVGKNEAWEDVVKSLKKMAGQNVKINTLTMPVGSPSQMIIKRQQPAQKIFLFDNNRQLIGKDFPPSSDMLCMHCAINNEDVSKIIFSVVPQMITTKKYLRFEEIGGDMRSIREPLIFTFNPLMMQMKIKRGDFIIIGPGTESRSTSTLGHHFFSTKMKGMKFETIIILRPAVFRIDIRKRRLVGPKPANLPKPKLPIKQN